MKKIGNLCVILIINKSILLYTIIIVDSPNLYIINSNRGIRFKNQDFILKSVSIFRYWASTNAKNKRVASCPARPHILSACYLTCKPKLIILYRWSATETYRSIQVYKKGVRSEDGRSDDAKRAVCIAGQWRVATTTSPTMNGHTAMSTERNKPVLFILPQWISRNIFFIFLILNTFEYNSPWRLRPRQSPNCLFMCRCSDPRFSVFWMSFCC